MKLYLVRHGDSISGNIDDERQLSDIGEKDVKRLAKRILPLKIQISQMLQSKKLRAQQTAGFLAPVISLNGSIETRIKLDPNASVSDIVDEIKVWNQDAMLVGHMPFMGKLVGKLITGNEYSEVVSFTTSSMVCLERVDNNRWIILWMLCPDILVSDV